MSIIDRVEKTFGGPKIQVKADISSVGTGVEDSVMTMRTPIPDTSGFARAIAFQHGEKNPNPMTQRPIDPNAEDINKCVTARIQALAEYSGMKLNEFLVNAEKAAVIARVMDVNRNKDWAKTHAENPNFRESIHTTPVKNKNIFNEPSERIAEYFSHKKVSPGGLGQSIRKLNYYLVRGGSKIPQEKRQRVHHALLILHERNLKNKGK